MAKLISPYQIKDLVQTLNRIENAITTLSSESGGSGSATAVKTEIEFSNLDERWSNEQNNEGFYELTLPYTSGTYVIAILCLDNNSYKYTLEDITYSGSNIILYSPDKFSGKLIMI